MKASTRYCSENSLRSDKGSQGKVARHKELLGRKLLFKRELRQVAGFLASNGDTRE